MSGNGGASTLGSAGPKPGDAFHVPVGDTADVRTVAVVLSRMRDGERDLGWLVKTHRGDHFILTPSVAMAERGVHFAGRYILPDRV